MLVGVLWVLGVAVHGTLSNNSVLLSAFMYALCLHPQRVVHIALSVCYCGLTLSPRLVFQLSGSGESFWLMAGDEGIISIYLAEQVVVTSVALELPYGAKCPSDDGLIKQFVFQVYYRFAFVFFRQSLSFIMPDTWSCAGQWQARRRQVRQGSYIIPANFAGEGETDLSLGVRDETQMHGIT